MVFPRDGNTSPNRIRASQNRRHRNASLSLRHEPRVPITLTSMTSSQARRRRHFVRILSHPLRVSRQQHPRCHHSRGQQYCWWLFGEIRRLACALGDAPMCGAAELQNSRGHAELAKNLGNMAATRFGTTATFTLSKSSSSHRVLRLMRGLKTLHPF